VDRPPGGIGNQGGIPVEAIESPGEIPRRDKYPLAGKPQGEGIVAAAFEGAVDKEEIPGIGAQDAPSVQEIEDNDTLTIGGDIDAPVRAAGYGGDLCRDPDGCEIDNQIPRGTANQYTPREARRAEETRPRGEADNDIPAEDSLRGTPGNPIEGEEVAGIGTRPDQTLGIEGERPDVGCGYPQICLGPLIQDICGCAAHDTLDPGRPEGPSCIEEDSADD